MSNLILEFSFDDGHFLDKKVARLLEKYGFTGTFFVPNVSIFDHKSLALVEAREMAKNGHKFGGHTKTHPSDMKLLDEEELKEEITQNKMYVEMFIMKEQIDYFCYPKGKYNEGVIEALKKAGFKKARTTDVGQTTVPKNLFRWGTTVHIHPSRDEYKGQNWLEYAKEKFKESQTGGYFHCWGHSEEINRYNLWDEFDELLKFVRDNM